MTEHRFIFRDLPGLQRLTDVEAVIAKHPNPEWAPEVDQRKVMVDELSHRLFGITEADTQFDPNVDLEDDEWYAARDQWDAHFAFSEIIFEDAETDDQNELMIWDMLGWDVRDAAGDIHPLLGYFQRQMVCATRGLKGRLPDGEMSDEEARDAAERWAANLMRKGT